jgi:hypothetical protein
MGTSSKRLLPSDLTIALYATVHLQHVCYVTYQRHDIIIIVLIVIIIIIIIVVVAGDVKTNVSAQCCKLQCQ